MAEYRVLENASIVGLGWQLNAGGCITRTVYGYPDEIKCAEICGIFKVVTKKIVIQ